MSFENKDNKKQAGAELGQAQLKLGLGFTSIKLGLPDFVWKICFSKVLSHQYSLEYLALLM